MVYSETNPEDIAKIDGDDDYDALSLGFKTIAATFNINQGAIRQQIKSMNKVQPWRQKGDQVSTVDFMEQFKKIKKKSPEIV